MLWFFLSLKALFTLLEIDSNALLELIKTLSDLCFFLVYSLSAQLVLHDFVD